MSRTVSETTWKKIWLLFGVFFILISVMMLIGAPVLASMTGTEPFSNRAFLSNTYSHDYRKKGVAGDISILSCNNLFGVPSSIGYLLFWEP